MKRHIQNSGFKKWFGNYFVELESEPLKAIDQWASAYEGCIISGGSLTLVSGTTYNVAAAMVVLKIEDEYKVAPLPATLAVDVSVQKAIRIKKTAVTGQYQNPSDLTIAYDYSAEIIDYTSGLGTLNEDYLLIPTGGGAIRSYADVLKDALAVATTAAKGLMSATDKTKMDGVATNANNYEHPSTHDASMINESSTKRFFTDTERTKLSGIAASANNYEHPSTHEASMINESTTRRFVTDTEKLGFWSGSSTVLSTLKNVGIGINDPTGVSTGTTLHLNTEGDTFPTFRISRSNGVAKTSSIWDGFIDSTGRFIFRDSINLNDSFIIEPGAPTNTLYIEGGGKIGFGMNNPGEKVQVNGNVKAASFIKEDGTASQFLKADGSVDSNTYLTAESDTLDSVIGRGATTTKDITVGKVYATKGRKVTGSVHGSTTHNTLFDALKTCVPTIGDEIIVSGVLGVFFVSKAKRTSSTIITLYHSSLSSFSENSTGTYAITDGSSSSISGISLAW